MTISSETYYTKLEGDGSATTFAFTFYIADSDHLKVTHIDSSGTETVLTEDTDYTVSGVGDASGGTVTYPVSGSALASGEYLYMQRDIPYTQTTDYDASSAPFPNTIESDHDRLVMLIQQINEVLSRVPKLDVGSSVTAEELINDILLNYGSMTGTAKGDMIVFDGSSWQMVAAGDDGKFLKADSATAQGVSWATVSGAVAADHSALENLSNDDHTQYVLANGERQFTNLISYDADYSGSVSDDKQLTPKKYVDDNFSASGHTHSDYVDKDGSVDFTAKVSYDDDKTFSDDKELVAKKYVDDKTWTHDETTLGYDSATDDVHSVYVKADGTRAFTGAVGGIDPVANSDLATKSYVDTAASSWSETIDIQAPNSTAATNRHVIFRSPGSRTATEVAYVLHSDSPGGTEEIGFDLKYGADLSGLTTQDSYTTSDISTEGTTTFSFSLSEGDYVVVDITSVTGSPENVTISVIGD